MTSPQTTIVDVLAVDPDTRTVFTRGSDVVLPSCEITQNSLRALDAEVRRRQKAQDDGGVVFVPPRLTVSRVGPRLIVAHPYHPVPVGLHLTAGVFATRYWTLVPTTDAANSFVDEATGAVNVKVETNGFALHLRFRWLGDSTAQAARFVAALTAKNKAKDPVWQFWLDDDVWAYHPATGELWSPSTPQL